MVAMQPYDSEYPDEWMMAVDVKASQLAAWADERPMLRRWDPKANILVAARGSTSDGWQLLRTSSDRGTARFKTEDLPGVREVERVELDDSTVTLNLILEERVAQKHQVTPYVRIELADYGRALQYYLFAGERLARILKAGGVTNDRIEELCQTPDRFLDDDPEDPVGEYNGRIMFKGGPWPEGHAARLELELNLEEDDDPWLAVSLVSAAYAKERMPREPPNASDWESPTLWQNFHNAQLEGAVPLNDQVRSLRELDGREYQVDHGIAGTDWSFDVLAFDHCQVLGHDAVAEHTFQFALENGKLQVVWRGKLARAYVQDYEFRYDFVVTASVLVEACEVFQGM